MADVNNLITDNIDVWTSALKKRNATGRGSSKKIELTGIKKLRELILDLAVRGKLVPQDVNDEPARYLLEKVAKERKQLVAEKKIKQQKPLPKLNTEDVDFILPSGWAIAYIPEVVAYDKYAIKRGPFGSSLKKAYFVSEGVKVYEQQHAIRDDFSLGVYYITDEKFKELCAFEIKPNDLIISCSGTVGKVAIAPDWMKKGIINQALLKITLNESTLTNAYFKILFPAFYMQTETLSDLQGTAQKNMVSVDTLKKEPFPLPSLAEQHRIVAKVDELMALCDELEQQTEQSLAAHQTLVETLLATLVDTKPYTPSIPNTPSAQSSGSSAVPSSAQNGLTTNAEDCTANVFRENWQRIADHFDTLFTTESSIESLKKTILQLAVMGKLVPQNPNDEPASVLLEKIAEEKAQLIADKKIKKQKSLPTITDEEKPFELPNGWTWTYLQDLCCFENGDRSSRYPNKSNLVDQGIPFFGAPDIKNGKLYFGSELRFISPEKFNELSNGKLVDKDFVMLLRGTVGKTAQFRANQEHKTGFINAQMLIVRFIETSLDRYANTYFSSLYFKKDIEDKKSGAVIQQIPASKISEMKIPVPPLAEQHRIAAKVDELMALCEQLKARLSDAQTTQFHLADAVVENALSVQKNN